MGAHWAERVIKLRIDPLVILQPAAKWIIQKSLLRRRGRLRETEINKTQEKSPRHGRKERNEKSSKPNLAAIFSTFVSHRYGMPLLAPSPQLDPVRLESFSEKTCFLIFFFHFSMFFFLISSLVNVFFFGFLARFLVYCKKRIKRNGWWRRRRSKYVFFLSSSSPSWSNLWPAMLSRLLAPHFAAPARSASHETTDEMEKKLI